MTERGVNVTAGGSVPQPEPLSDSKCCIRQQRLGSGLLPLVSSEDDHRLDGHFSLNPPLNKQNI